MASVFLYISHVKRLYIHSYILAKLKFFLRGQECFAIYHSMTCPSLLSAIDGLPQYLPVTGGFPISLNPNRIGISAPSACADTYQ